MAFVHKSKSKRARPKRHLLRPERLEDRCVPSATTLLDFAAGLNGADLLDDPLFATGNPTGGQHGIPAAAITGPAGNATTPSVGSTIDTNAPTTPPDQFSLNHLSQMATQISSISGVPQAPQPQANVYNTITVNTTADKYYVYAGNKSGTSRISLRDALRLVDGLVPRSDLTNQQQNYVNGVGFFGINDAITINTTGTILLTKALPVINDNYADSRANKFPDSNLLSISGPGSGNLQIDGANTFTILDVRDSSLTVSGVQFQHAAGSAVTINDASGNGNDGISAPYFKVNINTCTFVHNGGNDGGAISDSSISGRLTLTNDGFNYNRAYFSGGAVYVAKSFQTYITGCDFTQNTALGGGGAIQFGSGLYYLAGITGCQFISNSAGQGAAAVGASATKSWYMIGCTVTGSYTSLSGKSRYALSGAYLISQCALISNGYANTSKKQDVATVRLDAGEYLINDTIANNFGSIETKSGTLHGGGVIAYGGCVYNCTIVGNNGYGGLTSRSASTVVSNTIISLNHGGFGTFNSDITGNVNTALSSNNLIGIGGSGNITNGTLANRVGITTLNLTALQYNFGGATKTMFPYSNSTYVIDKGNNNVVYSHAKLFGGVDQIGDPRIYNGIVDIGAVEFFGKNPGPPKPPPPPGPGPQPIPGPSGFPKIKGGVFFTDGINQLWLLHNNEFIPTGGFALTFSAGIDAAGNPECFFLDGNHEIWRYDNGIFTALGAFATKISAGQGFLAFLDGSNELWTFTDTTGKFTGTGAFASQICAGANSKGQNSVYFLDGANGLWVMNPGGKMVGTGGSALAITAARDGAGNSEVYFLDGNRHLWNYAGGSFTSDTGPVGPNGASGSQAQVFFGATDGQLIQWLEGNGGANATGGFAIKFSANPNNNFVFFLDGTHQLWLYYNGKFYNTLAFGVNLSTF
jgi:hypothetical protein